MRCAVCIRCVRMYEATNVSELGKWRYALEVLLYYGAERLLALVQKRQVLEQHQAPLHLLEEGQIPTCQGESRACEGVQCVYVSVCVISAQDTHRSERSRKSRN